MTSISQTNTLVLAFSISMALGTSLVNASIDPAVEFSSPTVIGNNGSWSMGFSFLTNAAVTANALGFYDDGGHAGSLHDAGLYAADGTLLASTTITQGTGPVGHFDWASIPLTALAAGGTYYVAAVTGGSNYTWNPDGFAVDSKITFLHDQYTGTTTTLTFPADSSGDQGWFGANVSFVPLPAPLPLFGTALAGLGLMGRRRKEVTAVDA